MSMTMTWTTPQAYQAWSQRPPPAGWSGPWPPPPGSGPWPPGFPGPPPNTTDVSSQAWANGQWMMNPAYAANAAVAGAAAAWAPYQWNQQQAQAAQAQASYNPYKRVPKPTDPSYYQTELKDNGLGLFDMKKVDAPATPWIWAPKDLQDLPSGHSNGASASSHKPSHSQSSSSRRATTTQDQNYSDSRARAPGSREPSTSRPSSRRPSVDAATDRTGYASTSHTTSASAAAAAHQTSSSRHHDREERDSRYPPSTSTTRPTNSRSGSFSTDPHTRPSRYDPTGIGSYRPSATTSASAQAAAAPNDSSSRRATSREPRPSVASHSISSASGPQSAPPTTTTHPHHSYSHSTSQKFSSASASASANSTPYSSTHSASSTPYSTSQSAHTTPYTVPNSASSTPARMPESYTAKRDLQPTFSSNIVRTLDHYSNSAGNTPTHSAGNSQTGTPIRRGSHEGHPRSGYTTPNRTASYDANAGQHSALTAAVSAVVQNPPARAPSRAYNHPHVPAPPPTHGHAHAHSRSNGHQIPGQHPGSVPQPQPPPGSKSGAGFGPPPFMDDSPQSTVLAALPAAAPAALRQATHTATRDQERTREAEQRRKEKEAHRLRPARHELPSSTNAKLGPNGMPEKKDSKDSMNALGALAAFDNEVAVLSPLVESKPGLPSGQSMPSLGAMASAMQATASAPGPNTNASNSGSLRHTHARGVSRSHTLPFAAHGMNNGSEDTITAQRITPSSSAGTDSTTRPYYGSSTQRPSYDSREHSSSHRSYDTQDMPSSTSRAPPARHATYDSAMLSRHATVPARPPSRQAAAAHEAPVRPPSRSGRDPLAERAPTSTSQYPYSSSTAKAVPARPPSRGGYDAAPERAPAAVPRSSPSRPEESSYSSRYGSATAAAAPAQQNGYDSSRYDRDRRGHSSRPSVSASGAAATTGSGARSPYDSTSPTSPTYGGFANGGSYSRDRSPAEPADIAASRTAYPSEPRRSSDSRPPVSSSAAYAAASSRYESPSSGANASPAKVSSGGYTSRGSSSRPSSSSRYASGGAQPTSQSTSPYSYTSPHVSPPQGATTMGYSPSGQSSRSRGSGSTSSHRTTSSGSYNHLPAPPQPVSAPSSRAPMSSASAATGRKRRGLWNRRGDHLTSDYKIVYAPSQFANPPDLAGHPAAGEGWMDHHGQYVRASSRFTELEDSMPRHGREPRRPYESFIQYV